MTGWVITTTRIYSNMDGLGNPFVDGDSFTGNSGCRLTADQSGKAGANCILNANAYFYVSAGISALFNSGGNYYLQIKEGGRVYGNGTSGNNAIIGGDASTDAGRIEVYDGGQIIANYTTFQYFNNAYSIDVQGSEVMLINCTFSHFGTNTFRGYNGSTFYMDNCTWNDNDSSNCFFFSSYINYATLINCTMKSTTTWLSATSRASIKFVGSTTYDKNGAGPAEPNDTNDVDTPFVEDYQYYPELVLSEGGGLSGCSPTLFHSEQSGGEIIDSTTGRIYRAYLTFGQTNDGGDVYIYPLQKVYFYGVWKYFSDSGEAESGDNQKFTIGLVKDGYVYNTTTAWADAGTASITLSVDNQIVAHPKMFNQGMN